MIFPRFIDDIIDVGYAGVREPTIFTVEAFVPNAVIELVTVDKLFICEKAKP